MILSNLLISLILILTIVNIYGFNTLSRSSSLIKNKQRSINTNLYGARNRAWAKGDLSDKDIFEDSDDSGDGKVKKDKFKLEPETVLFDGPPSASEVLLPALSVVTVIGIIPFVSALSRQAWVRYKITSRRIAIQSGIGGKEQAEIIYPDIELIK
jgi:hypothetical protein